MGRGRGALSPQGFQRIGPLGRIAGGAGDVSPTGYYVSPPPGFPPLSVSTPSQFAQPEPLLHLQSQVSSPLSSGRALLRHRGRGPWAIPFHRRVASTPGLWRYPGPGKVLLSQWRFPARSRLLWRRRTLHIAHPWESLGEGPGALVAPGYFMDPGSNLTIPPVVVTVPVPVPAGPGEGSGSVSEPANWRWQGLGPRLLGGAGPEVHPLSLRLIRLAQAVTVQ